LLDVYELYSIDCSVCLETLQTWWRDCYRSVIWRCHTISSYLFCEQLH